MISLMIFTCTDNSLFFIDFPILSSKNSLIYLQEKREMAFVQATTKIEICVFVKDNNKVTKLITPI